MPAKKQSALRAELARFLKQYPDTGTLELLLPDVSGILKGKRIRQPDFKKVCDDGFFFCAGSTMLTVLGETVYGMPYTEIDGDPDIPAVLVPGSIAPVPGHASQPGRHSFAC